MSVANMHVPMSAQGGICTIGNFDGVHRGHQKMVSQVVEAASAKAVPAVVITFDPHPVCVLKPDVVLPALSSIETRTRLLKQYGADEVVVLPVDQSLLDMAPEEFFQTVIVEKLKAKGLVEGPNFRFGKDRSGDAATLAQLCRDHGLRLQIIDAVESQDAMISSSRIRQLLASDGFDAGIELLGHPYTITGTVDDGDGRGRELGFPTANLTSMGQNFLLPAEGVFAGRTVVAGKRYAVAVSIGRNPTFGDYPAKVECHLIDFDGNLYGQPLSVDLFRWVRHQQTFTSVQELVAAINRDVEACRAAAEAAGLK